MGRKWEKFCLLMWKNFLLQRRHPLQTIVEILAPVAFCSLLVVFRSLVDPTPHATIVYPRFEPSIEPIKTFTNNSLLNITWSPCNPYLAAIMKETSKELGLQPSECFDNAIQMQTYLIDEINLVFTIGGIQFDDSLSGNVTLPSNLKATIRFPGELRGSLSGLGQNTWRTNLIFAMYQIAGPRNEDKNETADPDYYGQGFLAVQQEVSYAIIKHFKSDFDKSKIPIEMRRFPYPAWIEDMLLPALQSFVGLIIMFSYAYTCINTVKVITMEKEKQLKEAMKIMGLPNWLHWLAWYLKSLCLFIVTAMLIVILLKVRWYPGTDFSVFTLSDPGVIFLFLIIYSSATITFCFAISTFFSKANTAATVAAMCWFLSFFPYSLMQDRYDVMPLIEKLVVCLFSNSGMAYGFQLMLMFEGTGEGFQWTNMWKTTTQDDTLTMGHVIIMLILDTFIYLLIALYVEAVLPGDYGVAQVWYFPFTSSFWKGTPKYVGALDFAETSDRNTMFEKEPNGQVGISIRHLRKEYAKRKVAVRDLSLNMYKDQITVLLGHNGAGKTTTMSMLTGMLPPTSGTAIIGRHDIRMDMEKVRESLGLCPQHNILFEDLTVSEHLYFFSRLKGMSDQEVGYEIRKYIELLQLIPKMHAKAKTLSGGMKRKLSVAVALCGDSKVVMCDEPTAGMDPSARRALWDLLQSQKKGRTILLTTHFMDEADLLGDRIAIMAGGKLQCCGSSFFLKKKYGAGYHLIMDKQSTCDVEKVTALLQKHIPGLKVESNIGSELTYILNEDYATVFEEMLTDLESHSKDLQINTYGISLTTLEEVFMKVGADHGQEEEQNESENSSRLIENAYHDYNLPRNLTLNNRNDLKSNRNDSPTPSLCIRNPYLTGYDLWKNQALAMIHKKFLILLRSWLIFTLQNCIPVLFLILAIIVAEARNPYRDLPNLNITLRSYQDTVTVYSATNSNIYQNQFFDMFKKSNYHLENCHESVIDHMLEETAANPTHVRQHYIIGSTFGQNNSITTWFNNEPYHSPPLALKTTMDTIIKTEVGPNYSIEVANHPLPFTISTRFRKLAQGQSMGFKIALNLGFSMAFVSSFYVMFYIKERVCKIKHLQFVSGVHVLTYWGTSFICDFITFTITLLCIIITLLVFQEDGFSSFYELVRFSSVFWYFGYAMLPMMYLSSYFFQVPSTGYTRMSFINIFSGVAAFLIVQFLSVAELGLANIAETLHWIFLTIPHYAFSAGIRDIHKIYAMKNLCMTLIQGCIDFDNPRIPHLNPAQCRKYVCRAQSECCTLDRSYYSWNSPGIGRNVVFSLAFGTVCIAILLLVEYRIFTKFFNCLQERKVPPNLTFNSNEDNDVLEEKAKIRDASDSEIAQYSLALRDITKYYKNFLAVNNLCLGVNRYECFGLLGVNGAGKTTTFKMITGDVKMSYGDVWVNGISLKQDMKLVHKFIGYCPQFDGLLDDLTGRETLTVFCMLRGITYKNSKYVVEQLAKDFDFLRHIDKKVKEYSGGNKRKLSTAVALVGDPDVLYFDEPTTGMDPATKRHLWNALCRLRDNGKCIILTSHSMEECEALCTRLAIMVNGSFLCIGSTQHLKSKYSEGYTLAVKVQKVGEELDAEQVKEIQRYVKEKFPSAVVREKHQELLTFYIADKSLPWSRMFGIMERGKKHLSIEDYSLGQCSLEQVRHSRFDPLLERQDLTKSAAMSQTWTRLKLLLWKNYRIANMEPFSTIFAIIAPWLYIMAFGYIRMTSTLEDEPPLKFDSITLERNILLDVTHIGWSPCDNKVLQDIMKKVASSLKLREICFKNANSMEHVLSNTNESYLAGLQFDDELARKSIPKSIDIRLRFSSLLRPGIFPTNGETWETSHLFPRTKETVGPRLPFSRIPTPDYDKQQFLLLQREVSFGLIEHFSSKFNRKQTDIKLLRMPHPAWTNDPVYGNFVSLLPYILVLGLLHLYEKVFQLIVIDKETQMKETLMIMGLARWVLWMSWFLTFFIYILISSVVAVVIFIIFNMFPRSNQFIILLLLVFYSTSSITLCFMISNFFSKSSKASTVGSLILLITFLPCGLRILNDRMYTRIFVGLFPNTVLVYSITDIVNWESLARTGLQWDNLWEHPTPASNDTVGFGMVMLVIDTVLYMLLTLYIEQIIPGEYGIAKKWYFPLMLFDIKQKSTIPTSHTTHNLNYFEEEPSNLKAGIKIKNLRKSFGDSVAVNGLTLNMYENQITALLGHNGAGKTTTIMMLIGMYPPSGGTAILNGHDIRNEMDEIRKSLGICPQHNVLFDNLTVKEHMYFFCKLKGLSDNRIEQEITRYLTSVELTDKVDTLSKNLSGGMKRKLSVATALCGDSKIVICDEPSSGMDPSARRSLWDFLQSQKHGRTILLTTHFMDEADVLGDRIAIMAEGQLQCCGSSYFLKKKFGSGYHLVVDKLPSCNVKKVTGLLQKHIPTVKMEKDVGSEIIYAVSADNVQLFEKALEDLESHGGSLGVRNFGISLNSMEEIFMKFGTDTTSRDNGSNFHSVIIRSAFSRETTSNFCYQILAMLLKRTISWMKQWGTLIIIFVIPILYILLKLEFNIFHPDEMQIDLSKYESPVTLIGGENTPLKQTYTNMLRNQNQLYNDVGSINFPKYIIDEGNRSYTTYVSKYIVGAVFKKQDVTAYFNGEAYHSSPLALGLVINALLQSQTGSGYSINIFNYPLEFKGLANNLKDKAMTTLLEESSVVIVMILSFITILHISFYVKERNCGFKHTQFVSGVNAIIFWTVALVCDMVTYTMASLMMPIVSLLLQVDFLKIPIVPQCVIFICYAISLFPLLYLLAFLFQQPATAINVLLSIILLIVSIAQIMIIVYIVLPEKVEGSIWYFVFSCLPCFNCMKAIHFALNFYAQKEKNEDQSIYSWDNPGIGEPLAYMSITGLFFFILLILVEYGVVQRIIYLIRLCMATPPRNTPLDIEPDEDVLEEERLVRNMSKDEIKQHCVTMKNVTKYFGKFVAVNQVCLAVKGHECFGLLGINGAGKTTTFRMLTGEKTISYGDAWIQGWSVKNQMKNAYKVMGYCPQFDALLDDFTGKEHMKIICLLRGVNCMESNGIIADLAHQFNFYNALNKATKNLSGGNKRKLSTAIAIIGDPPIIYLDEPTSGMDPGSKRHVWNVLTQLREDGKCIILTSHSMEECEALCTRLTIMVRGKFLCLGSRQRLKSKYSTGFNLLIKTTTSNEDDLNQIESFVVQKFPSAVLKKKLEKLLMYYISDASMKYSVMFGIMEKGKQSYGIEDYAITQCDLEQVFLSFANPHQ